MGQKSLRYEDMVFRSKCLLKLARNLFPKCPFMVHQTLGNFHQYKSKNEMFSVLSSSLSGKGKVERNRQTPQTFINNYSMILRERRIARYYICNLIQTFKFSVSEFV